MRPHVKQKAVAVSMFVSAVYGDVWHKAKCSRNLFCQPIRQNLLVKYLKIWFSLRKDVDYAFVRVKTVALSSHYLSAVADQAGAPMKDRWTNVVGFKIGMSLRIRQ